MKAGQDTGRCCVPGFPQKLLRDPKVAACLYSPVLKKSWALTTQSSIRVAASGVAPDTNFSIFRRDGVLTFSSGLGLRGLPRHDEDASLAGAT